MIPMIRTTESEAREGETKTVRERKREKEIKREYDTSLRICGRFFGGDATPFFTLSISFLIALVQMSTSSVEDARMM